MRWASEASDEKIPTTWGKISLNSRFSVLPFWPISGTKKNLKSRHKANWANRKNSKSRNVLDFCNPITKKFVKLHDDVIWRIFFHKKQIFKNHCCDFTRKIFVIKKPNCQENPSNCMKMWFARKFSIFFPLGLFWEVCFFTWLPKKVQK